MPELEKERQIYLEHLDGWRQTHLGEFVLIKHPEVVGFFATVQEAFGKGAERFGLEPFLVQQIAPKDTVHVSFYGARVVSP